MKRTIDTILWPALGFAVALCWVLGGCWANAGELASHQERTLIVSNVLYVVKYDLKSTAHYSVPLTNPLGQPHYPCKTTVWIGGTNRISSVDSEWTENGCFEDSPMLVIGAALAWTRYPNNSAGEGTHWRIRGGAMFTESDKENP